MKRLFVAFLALVSAAIAVAQPADTTATSLLFDEVEWNFGRIEEDGGKVSHTFGYTNTAPHPVSIERVYSSCGCTTGDYSRRPLKTGASEQFTVTFDPDGRPGRFDKRITIVYDQGRGRTILRIKGVVKGRKRSNEDLYPYALGSGVRADATYKAFGNVEQGGSKSMTIALVNTSDEGVSIEPLWEERSGLLELFLPDTLAPKEVALATATYLLSEEEPRYGLLRDRVSLMINGTPSGEVFTTTAFGVDHFEKNATRKPRAVIEPSWYDFGVVEVPSVQRCVIRITNEGTAPLVVRNVTPREGTKIMLPEGTTIAPSETLTVKVELEVPAGTYDTLFGGGMIVVNDPARPVRELRFGATAKKK
ncbi:MAG: DUF1573 domain-containing protein [Tidjanibacter sp.]|nr:DUF1573 domain-containing protein [Tidjanibacter sp.]